MSTHNHGATDATDESPIFEFSASRNDFLSRPHTADDVLLWMVSRLRRKLPPLPDGYVPPPGIDIKELLKQLPERYSPKTD